LINQVKKDIEMTKGVDKQIKQVKKIIYNKEHNKFNIKQIKPLREENKISFKGNLNK